MMDKTKRRFAGGAIFVSIALAAIMVAGLVDTNKALFNNGADTNALAITMNSSKNNFFSSSGSTSGSGTFYTENGNGIDFSYKDFSSTVTSGTWHTLSSGGLFYNTTKITDITSVSITAYTAGSIGVYWSADPDALNSSTDLSALSSDFEVYALAANQTYTFTLENDHPNYVLIANKGTSDITISDASIGYGCVNDYYSQLSVSSESSTKGTVSGSGYYRSGSNVTVTATPNDGYHFLGWYEGSTQVSTSSSYTFVMPSTTTAYSLIAKFEEWSEVYVNAPSAPLSEDFAYGMDMSEVYELEDLGANYTDKNGNAIDVFEIIKNAGVNYVRFRLWVNPFSGTTNISYGGGSNSLTVDLAMAQRAQDAGLKIMIDFHLSDTYTDPDTQIAPKSFASYSTSEYPTLVYNHVKESLNTFKNNGITVSSVQIGNETTAKVCGQAIGSTTGLSIIQYGINAAKEVFPSIKTIVHVTTGYNSSGYRRYYQTFTNALANGTLTNVDIIGFSYYPYYHGASVGLDNLTTQLTEVANLGYDVMVVETAWGYTDDWTDDTNNTFYTTNGSDSTANVAECGYDTSTQAQATVIYDIVNVLAGLPSNHGKGIFYWGADWYPVKGTQWISPTGMYYAEVNPGTDAETEPALTDTYTLDKKTYTYADGCKATWANQALFDYDGQALPSLYTYKHLQDQDNTLASDSIVGLYYGYGTDELSYSCGLDELDSTLPTTIDCATKLGRKVSASVDWDTSSVTSDGEYVITGTVTYDTYSAVISANLTVVTSSLVDGGFEAQTSDSTINNTSDSPWTLTTSLSGAVVADWSNQRTGKVCAKFWASSDYTFDLSQSVSITDTGYYDFEIYAKGYISETGGYLYYSIDGADPVTGDYILTSTTSDYTLYTLSDIYCESVSTLTVGVYGSCTSASWGYFDDAVLRETVSIGFKDGSFENQTAGSAPTSPWTVTDSGMTRLNILEGSELLVDSSATSAKYLEYYASSAASFSLSQTFNMGDAGTYQFAFYINTSNPALDGSNYFSSFTVTFVTETFTKTVDITSWNRYWYNTSGNQVVVGTFDTTSAKEEVTVTLDVSVKAEAWGLMDVFTVNPYTAS